MNSETQLLAEAMNGLSFGGGGTLCDESLRVLDLLLSVFFFSSDVDSAMDQVASHMVGLIRVSSMTFGAFG